MTNEKPRYRGDIGCVLVASAIGFLACTWLIAVAMIELYRFIN